MEHQHVVLGQFGRQVVQSHNTSVSWCWFVSADTQATRSGGGHPRQDFPAALKTSMDALANCWRRWLLQWMRLLADAAVTVLKPASSASSWLVHVVLAKSWPGVRVWNPGFGLLKSAEPEGEHLEILGTAPSLRREGVAQVGHFIHPQVCQVQVLHDGGVSVTKTCGTSSLRRCRRVGATVQRLAPTTADIVDEPARTVSSAPPRSVRPLGPPAGRRQLGASRSKPSKAMSTLRSPSIRQRLTKV